MRRATLNLRTLSHLAIVILLVLGTVGVVVRYQKRQANRQLLEESRWRIAYEIRFRAEGEETTLRYAVPFESAQVALESEEWGEPLGLEAATKRYVPSGTRIRVLSTKTQSDYLIRPQFTMRLNPRAAERLDKVERLGADQRSYYLREESAIRTRLEGVRQLVQQAEEECDIEVERIVWFYHFCTQKLKTAEAGADSGVLSSLSNGAATPLGRVRTMVTLCRASGVPARVVTGFELRNDASFEPRVWLEVYREHRWWPMDPVYGYTWTLPASYVPVRRGGEQIVRLTSGAMDRSNEVKVEYTIRRLEAVEDALLAKGPGPADMLDLTRLPLEMQKVLALLLLLPFGALITALFRNVIGVMTFGTFAPVLFAVSFIDADWGTGLAILLVVVVAGLAGRMLLEQLRLLMVPRLSIVLTTVILCVVFCVSALDYLRLTPSADAVLLPLVILTILIERFTVTTEEDSLAESMRLLAGTLFVAGCCYLVLRWEVVGRTIVIYPEAHCLTIAALIAIGRYTGYRLVELWRFRDLVGPGAKRL